MFSRIAQTFTFTLVNLSQTSTVSAIPIGNGSHKIDLLNSTEMHKKTCIWQWNLNGQSSFLMEINRSVVFVVVDFRRIVHLWIFRDAFRKFYRFFKLLCTNPFYIELKNFPKRSAINGIFSTYPSARPISIIPVYPADKFFCKTTNWFGQIPMLAQCHRPFMVFIVRCEQIA